MFLKYIKSTFIENRLFFLIYLSFLSIGGIFLLIYPKGIFLLLLNKNHNAGFDFFFKSITILGDGLFILPLIILFAFIKLRHSILILSSYLLSGALAQILKRIFDTPRPKAYFTGKELLNFVQGVDVYSFHSFPSGHAATAFSYCLVIAMATGNKSIKFISFLLALFIAVSRVYLCQHFLIDIYFGSMLGITSTLVLDYIFRKNTKLNSSEWFNHRVFKKSNS